MHSWKEPFLVWLKHRLLTGAHAFTVTPGMETSTLTIILSERDWLLRLEAVGTLLSSPPSWGALLLMWWSGSPTHLPVVLLGANGEVNLQKNKHGSDKNSSKNCFRSKDTGYPEL